MESVRAPKVAYVLGVYRSGTTLLSNMAGQLDGFFCVGELRAIWRELGLATARCGCGLPLLACERWNRILELAYGSVAEAMELAPHMLRWQQKALGESHTWRRVPGLIRRRTIEAVEASSRRYAAEMSRLYVAIRSVTGANVIVDSSKEPTDAALIGLLPDISAYFVHIVRDPRGTVFSSMRARFGSEGPVRYQLARSGYAAMSWVAGNLAAGAVRRAHGRRRSLLLRYEDLVEMPDRMIDRIAAFVGEPASAPMCEDGAMLMAPTHTVCGNENRFRTGRVQFAKDTAWRTNLRTLDRYMVTAICAPVMLQYGYFRPQGPRPSIR